MNETIDLGKFPLGKNNIAKETSLPEGSLRDAINVDIDNSGKPRLREGYKLIYGLASVMLTVTLWAGDWQREQDQKMADMDKLITRQSTLLEMRIEYDEYNANKRRMESFRPVYAEEEIDFSKGVEVK